MALKSDAATPERPAWLMRLLWTGLLGLIGCDLVLAALRVASYPTYLRWPGAAGYLAEPLATLVAYALIIAALPLIAARVDGLGAALSVGAVVGLVGGGLDIAGLTLESLFQLPQAVVSVATGVAMLALFGLFALAGYLATRRARSFWLGLAAAVWSSIVAILAVVTFGFLLATVALPQLARNEIGDPDYTRSGWTDPRAFAIANTFDNGYTHMIEAPVIAAILGSFGAGLALVFDRRYGAPE